MNVVIKAQGTSPANLLSRSGDTQTVKSVTCCLTVDFGTVRLLHSMLDQIKKGAVSRESFFISYMRCYFKVNKRC